MVSRALSILNKYQFKKYTPDDRNLPTYSGPGIVVVCCHQSSTKAGEDHFKVLKVYEAENVGEVGVKLAKQNWSDDCSTRIYVLLGDIPDKNARLQAIQELRTLCNEGKK